MNLPILNGTEKQTDFNQDEYIMIRGFPRPRKNVEYVEQMLSGKLVGDNEAALMAQLDSYLFKARKETGKYPDLLQLPSEPFSYFCPIPFDIYFYGMTLKSWKKPAWWRIPRTMNVQLPWSNK